MYPLFVISWMNVYEGYSTSGECGPITVCVCTQHYYSTTPLFQSSPRFLKKSILYLFAVGGQFNTVCIKTQEHFLNKLAKVQKMLWIQFSKTCLQIYKNFKKTHTLRKNMLTNLQKL